MIALLGAGIEGTVQLLDNGVHVHLVAPGPGWVVFGVKDGPGLDGAHLAMVAALPDGTTVAEHHVADPPNHAAVASSWIRSAHAVDAKQTTVDLVLDPRAPGLPVFDKGATLYVTLAWSRSDDFQHHSARRTEVSLNL